ncbi:MAG: hypothetical protein WB609_14280 [Candidatus Cybelea sp.]
MFSASSFAMLRADDSLNGTWSLLTESGGLRLEVNWSNGREGSHDSTLRPIDANALGIAGALASGGEHVRFALHREAGDYAMEGWIGGGKGGGTYTYTPNAAFFAYLQKRGISVDTPGDELTAADLDLTREFVEEMLGLGYHLDFNALIELRALRVDRAYVEAMRAQGVTGLDQHSVVELKALRVDASYIQELAAGGYPHLSANEYVQLKALHVDGAYLKRLASHGLTHLTVEQVINYKALGIK